jgi:uncharacterized protein (TIGR03435 family)
MPKPGIRLFATWAISAAIACASSAQQPVAASLVGNPTSSKPLTYEVVSIKENIDGTNNVSMNSFPGGIKLCGVRLIDLVRSAYGLYYSNDDQIQGLPAWAHSKHFNIEARVGDDDLAAYGKLDRKGNDAMLQGILADRFKMTAHRVTNEEPVYALLIGKHGSKLVQFDLNAPSTNGRFIDGCKGGGCMSWGNGHLEAKGIAMEALVNFLTQETERTVIDKTGLSGKYDLTLDWTSTRHGQPPDPSSNAPPEIFTAVQEQLGLKLESQKGPVDGVIIDHVEEPSPN